MNRNVSGFHDGAPSVFRFQCSTWWPHTSHPNASYPGRMLVASTNTVEAANTSTVSATHSSTSPAPPPPSCGVGRPRRARRTGSGASTGLPIGGAVIARSATTDTEP